MNQLFNLSRFISVMTCLSPISSHLRGKRRSGGSTESLPGEHMYDVSGTGASQEILQFIKSQFSFTSVSMS